MSNKISNTNEFITKAKIKHSDKYNYLLVDSINAKTKIKIICPIHGEFQQSPDNHLYGQGCGKYCLNNNIKLIVLPYNKNNNMILEKIIKQNV